MQQACRKCCIPLACLASELRVGCWRLHAARMAIQVIVVVTHFDCRARAASNPQHGTTNVEVPYRSPQGYGLVTGEPEPGAANP